MHIEHRDSQFVCEFYEIHGLKQFASHFHCQLLPKSTKFIEIKYGQLNRPKPSINVILVLAKDEVFTKDKEKSLKSFVRKFSGSSEILRGANEIRSAASKR